MKSLCYKLMLLGQRLLSYLVCLVFALLLFGVTTANAAVIYSTTGTPDSTSCPASGANGLIFQSSGGTITDFTFHLLFVDPWSGSYSFSAKVCEVSSLSSVTCLTGTDYTQGKSGSGSFGGNVQADVTYTLGTPYAMTAGHFYLIQPINSASPLICAMWANAGATTPSNRFWQDSVAYNLRTIGTVNGTVTPTINGTVYWAGVGSQYGKIGALWSVPFYWNVCSSYGSINDLYASFRDGIYDEGESINLIKDKTTFIGAQKCSGISYYNLPVQETSPSTFNGHLALYTTTDGDISTSSDFNVIVNYGGTTENFLDASIVSPLHLNYGVGTTTLPFSYDFTGMAYSSSTVCIYNEVSKTSSNCVAITAANGIGLINFPDPLTEFTLNAHYVLYSSGGVNLMSSDSFIINWYNTPPKPGKNVCQSVDTAHICDNISTSTMGSIQCALVQAGVWLFQPSCSSLNNFTDNYTTFKGAFPFNTYFQLVGTIDEAIGTTTTSTKAVFSIPMVKSTGTIYMLPIISSSSLSNAIGSSNNNLFRQTMSWLMWIIAAGVIGLTIYFV